MKVSRLVGFGPYRLDLDRRLLLRKSEPVPLQQKALEILIVLVQNRGEVVSKDDLMKAVWPDAFVEEANLTQNVFVLRKTLGEGPKENRYIATVPGRGYRFVADVEDVSEHEPGAQRDSPQDAALQNEAKTADKEPETEPSFRISSRARLVMLLAAGAILIFAATTFLPTIARYYNNKGVSLQQAGNLKAAIGDFQLALRFNSGYSEAHYNLANAYEDIPDYDKAIDQYQQAIDVDPTFYPAYNNLSRLYIMRRRDYEAALRLLDRAMSLHPQEESVQYTLYKNYGWADLRLGQFGQAEEYLRLAERLDSSRGSAHCLRAKLLETQGKAADARTEWESCLADSNEEEVEPEWRHEAQEHLGRVQ
jgi:DNA-binding winged helix-turn-helix (wHTH) protein/Flp pilus assembly protein TadD